MIRVVHVKSLYGQIGGIESMLEGIIPDLAAHETVSSQMILVSSHVDEAMAARLSGNGLLPLTQFDWFGLKSVFARAKAFAKLMQEQKIDVVHTHDMRANLLVFLARRHMTVGWICHIHGWLGNTHSGVHRLYEAIDRKLVRYADHVMVGSYATLAEVKAAGATEATVAWNAVTIPQKSGGDRSQLGLPEDAVILSILGRLHYGKGQDLFLDALAGLETSQNWHGVIIGAGDAGIEEILDKKIVDLNLTGRVIRTGFVDTTRPWLAASDIVVVPSRKESLPLTCLEGMAHSKPVIASHAGDLPRVVLEGKTGFIVDIESPNALRDAMQTLIDDPVKRRDFGRNARLRIEQSHTTKSLAVAMADTALAMCGRKV